VTGRQSSRINGKTCNEPKLNLDSNYILIRVGKHAAEALVDTGAVYSMISEPFAKQLKLTIQPLEGPNDRMVFANGSTMRVVKTVSMKLYLKGLWNMMWLWPST